MFGATFGEGIHNATLYHTQYTRRNAALLLNNSVFYHISRKFVLGIEIVLYIDAEFSQTYIGFFPQFFLALTDSLNLQSGVGITYSQGGFKPELIARLISSGWFSQFLRHLSDHGTHY